MRHGEATRSEVDPERPLTLRGRKQVLQVGRWLRRLGVKFSRVLSSPRRRAQETALIIATQTSFPPEQILTEEKLLPEADISQLLTMIFTCQAEEKILLVGHLPSLAVLAGLLAGINSGEIFHFSEAGLCRIDRTGNRPGTVVWLVSPEAISGRGGGRRL